MGLLFLVLAAFLLVWGVVALVNGSVIFGLILIVVGVILGGNGRTRLE